VLLVVLGSALIGAVAGWFLGDVVERVRPGETALSRRWLVAVLCAAACAVLGAAVGIEPELPAFLYLGVVGVALALIDLDTRRLPNQLTLPSYLVAAALLGIAALAEGQLEPFVRAVLGGLVLFGFYLVLALISPSGLGFGDVKLAGVLGLYLGWLGWGVLFVGAFLGFLAGALVSIALLATRRAGRKSTIPFGPSMLVGALAAVAVGDAIADLYTGGLA
jgi:leader peptidase (prepilin peptidase) / N-methyltransferase